MYLVTRNNQVIGEFGKISDFIFTFLEVSIDQIDTGWSVTLRNNSKFHAPNTWTGTWSDNYSRVELIADIARDMRVRNFVRSCGFVIYKAELV